MWIGFPAPTTAVVIPDNGDDTVNINSTSTFGDLLNNYQIEEGHTIGVLNISCSENGDSELDSISFSTSGGGYASYIDISKCSDLTSVGGAAFQIIGTAIEPLTVEVSCQDCQLFTIRVKQNTEELHHWIGMMWVVVDGPNPQLVVVGK